MALTEFSGPLLVSGGAPGTTNNPDLAPSLLWGGAALSDPRFAYQVGASGNPNGATVAYGFAKGENGLFVDAAPSAAATNNIAAAAHPVSGTPMTLVSSSGAGITVTTSATTIPQTGKVVPSGALAIDGLPGVITYGQNRTLAVADPSKAIARAVSVTAVASATGGVFTVAGYDLYGYPQTEDITAVANTTVNGKKGFKFITSVTPAVTDGSHNYSVGTADIFEFPVRVDKFGYTKIFWNNALITANTGFVAADATTATATTGDVRGTYATQSSADGTKQLQVYLAIPPNNYSTLAGWFGVTPA